MNQKGTRSYGMGPGALFAIPNFSNHYMAPVREMISIPEDKGVNSEKKVNDELGKSDSTKAKTRLFRIRTAEGIEMDGWMVKPLDFDSTKKYPVVFLYIPSQQARK